MKALQITNEYTNITFNVVIINKGDSYGLNNCLIADKCMVEFYDTRYMHTKFGQFVSRYYIETLNKFDYDSGLDLYGGVDGWYLTIANVKQVKQFIK